MAGLDPAIHAFLAMERKTWMPGTSPGMTKWQKRAPPRLLADALNYPA
jgi:hypothetical protein